MKKYSSYIIAGIVTAAVIILLITGKRSANQRLNERITFGKADKIPYGMYVAYKSLPSMFPSAKIYSNRKEPGYWDSLSTYDRNQVAFIVVPEFNADSYEMKNIIRFAQNGNNVFISASELSSDVSNLLKCAVSFNNRLLFFTGLEEPDTLTVSLAHPPFPQPSLFSYPGKQYDAYFSRIDSVTTTRLGYNKAGEPDFVHLRTGSGNIYVHLAPMTFTNYFLVHKDNFHYYERALSVIPANTTKVLWDEYFLFKKGNKDRNKDNKKNWLAAILSVENSDGQRSFAAAFWVLLGLLLLYTLIEMRRKQRYIPVVKKLRNDSLDFVKTIGRLYHDKGDHRNLSRKMSAYFLEYVRSRFKLPTARLDDEFVKNLHFKTGVEQSEIMELVDSIKQVDESNSISADKMIAFHKQLESFYKKI